MDYSLLIGIHDQEVLTGPKNLFERSKTMNPKDLGFKASRFPSIASLAINLEAKQERRTAFASTPTPETDGIPQGSEALPVSSFQSSHGGIQSTDGSKIYYIGLIDFLVEYTMKKKTETFIKSLHLDLNTVSVINPVQYAKRFRDFISKAFDYEPKTDFDLTLTPSTPHRTSITSPTSVIFPIFPSLSRTSTGTITSPVVNTTTSSTSASVEKLNSDNCENLELIC